MNPEHPALSVDRQLRLLEVPRSSYYYRRRPNFGRVCSDERAKDEMRAIYMECPFYGVPRMTLELNKRGCKVNHKRVRRIHRELGLKTVYPRPKFNTSSPCEEHKKYPYLLRNLPITRPNQVWATDITYTAVAGHRAFVIAIIDLFSRKVLAYNVVNTMDTAHCVETLELAVRKYGRPEIFNSDQGSQFTSREFTEILEKGGISISMDGKGRCLDNAKMERFWWALKYENIKIMDYLSLAQLRMGVQSYVNFYNSRRPHTALGGLTDHITPDEIYFGTCAGAEKVV